MEGDLLRRLRRVSNFSLTARTGVCFDQGKNHQDTNRRRRRGEVKPGLAEEACELSWRAYTKNCSKLFSSFLDNKVFFMPFLPELLLAAREKGVLLFLNATSPLPNSESPRATFSPTGKQRAQIPELFTL